MALEDIYIQEMDRATSRLEVTRINPTRQFLVVALKEDGRWAGSPALYQWQNGDWYDTGGNPLDAALVPEKFRAEIDATPVTVTSIQGPAVTGVCKFCHEKMNSSELNQHYIKHVEDTLADAGSRAEVVPPPVDVKAEYAKRPVTAKNTHAEPA